MPRGPMSTAVLACREGDRPDLRSAGAVGSNGARAAVRPSRRGLRFDAALPYDTWKALGARLAARGDAAGWWLGDWLVFGRESYGRRYKQAVEETGLEYQTLRNNAVVARRFPMSRRRNDLSFQHLRRGDLTGALSEASELPRPLPTAQALALVVMLGDTADVRHGRWAARWIGRVALERDSVTLATVTELAALLGRAAGDDPQARAALAALAERHGAVGADSLLTSPSRPPGADRAGT
jgi:hypothetical protein